MPVSESGGRFLHRRQSPRLPFDALIKLVGLPSDRTQQVWCRSTDISQGGIGVNLMAEDMHTDDPVSLQIPLPPQGAIDVRVSLRYRIGQHCGFAFLDLSEGQGTALRLACDTLARAQSSETPPS